MMYEPIEPNISAWIRCGFNRAKRFWLPLYIIAVVIQLPTWLSGSFGVWGVVISGVWTVFFYSVLYIGYQLYVLKIGRGDEKARPSALLDVFQRYLTLLGAFILYILGALIGLALLIVPGIIFLVRYYFAFLAIVDKGLGIHDAFAWSAEITEGYKLKLFLLNLGWIALSWVLLVIFGLIYSGFSSVSMWTIGLVNVFPGVLIMPWFTASIAAAYASLSMNAKKASRTLPLGTEIFGLTNRPIGCMLVLWLSQTVVGE